MAQQIYTVKAPDGSLLKIKGPAGATPDQVIAQAQRLHKISAPPGIPKPALPAELQPQEPRIQDRIRRGMTDLSIGAGKQLVGGTALNISRGLGFVPPETTAADIGMEPQGTMQNIGAGAESIAEFFVPGGAVNRGVKAVQGVTKGLPVLARGALNLGARAGLEAGSVGAVTAAQGGDVRTNAGIAAAIPVAGAIVAPAANAVKAMLSTRLPGRIVESIIKPPKNMKTFMREPGQEVAVQGLKANTLTGLEKEIAARSDEIGAVVDATLKLPENAAKRIDVVSLINKPIDDAIAAAKVDGNAGLVKRLEDFRNGQFLERFKLSVTPKSLRLSPLDARKMKTEIGKSVRWTEDPIEGTLNDVKQDIYRNLNAAIETAVPGTRAMNKSYANLLSAEKSIQRRIDAVNNLNLVGLTQAATGTGVALVTASLSGDISDSILAGLLSGAAVRATKNPRIVTELAAALAKLAPGERTALAKAIPAIRNAYLGLSGNAAPPESFTEVRQRAQANRPRP